MTTEFNCKPVYLLDILFRDAHSNFATLPDLSRHGYSGMAGAELCFICCTVALSDVTVGHLWVSDQDRSPDNRLLEWQSSLPFTACFVIAMGGRVGIPSVAKERLRA